MYTLALKTSRLGAAGTSTGRLFHSRTVLGSKAVCVSINRCVVGLETMWCRGSTSCAPIGWMIGSWNCQMSMNHLVQENKTMYIISPLKRIPFKMPEHITETICSTEAIWHV